MAKSMGGLMGALIGFGVGIMLFFALSPVGSGLSAFAVIVGGVFTILGLPVGMLLEGEGAIKTCPECAESVKKEAKACKHSGTKFSLEESPNISLKGR